MKKIAVLVSGGGTNLAALIKAEKSGVIKSGKDKPCYFEQSEGLRLGAR